MIILGLLNHGSENKALNCHSDRKLKKIILTFSPIKIITSVELFCKKMMSKILHCNFSIKKCYSIQLFACDID